MRIVLVLVALAALVLGGHFDVSPQNELLNKTLEEAYSFYLGKGLTPLPPCNGDKYKVYIDSNAQYPAYTTIGGNCVVEQRFRPSFYRRLVFHEVGHIFIEGYFRGDYFWADEAAAEAMASVATGEYTLPSSYFAARLYRVNPFGLGEDRVDLWYKYSAVVAWYLQNSDRWDGVIKTFASRDGAAGLYVKFLLALAKGLELGGNVYKPEYEVVELRPGAVRAYPKLDGYTATYYEVRAPPGGILRVEVVGGARVVSNIALGRDIVLNNGSLIMALVNNSTDSVEPTVVFYYSLLNASVAGGTYRDGRISVTISAEYSFERINGVVRINGTDVYFSDGIGIYNFTGELKPYVLRLEYGSSWAELYLNLSQPQLSISPNKLYLDKGGRGVVNVTVNNQNPIDIECALHVAGTGISSSPRSVRVPTGLHTYNITFYVVNPPQKILVGCGKWGEEIQVERPTYELIFDLDKWSGVLTARFGRDVVNYTVEGLPANVSLRYRGYTAAVVEIPKPELLVKNSTPRLEGIYIVYQLSISVSGPPWAFFKGDVKVGDDIKGYYQGGVFNTTLALSPGDARTVTIAVGRIGKTLRIEAPHLQAELLPIRAVVTGRDVKVLALVRYNVVMPGGAQIEIRDPSLGRPRPLYASNGSLVELNYAYSEIIGLEYAFLGERKGVSLSFPRPRFIVSLISGTVTPAEFYGVFNITAEVCNPSTEARYEVDIDGRTLLLRATPHSCAYNWTKVEWRARYSQELTLSVDTSFGKVEYKIHVPPPSVDAEVLKWTINGDGEYASVKVVVKTAGNYSYEVLGRRVSGQENITKEVKALNGTAVIDYGFGSLVLKRPLIHIQAKPLLVEAGTSFNMSIELVLPKGLYIDADLSTSLGGSKRVSVGAGREVVTIAVSGVGAPGIYNVILRLGPYANSTTVVAYRVDDLSLSAPSAVPIGREVEIRVAGHVTPQVVVPVIVEIRGCGNVRSFTPLNGSLFLKFDKPCTAEVVAYTNTSKTFTTVAWASLRAEVAYDKLGVLSGLPVFAVGTLTSKGFLGDRQINASIRMVGFYDKLGLVNFTAYVEYMGVVNFTKFVGFAAPRDSYIAANKTAALLPPQAREYFLYLFQKAVATGDWELVDGISRLYSAPPTPFAVVARYLVERDLSRGRDPNIYVAEVLQRVEPFALGLAGGLTLALLRRLF